MRRDCRYNMYKKIKLYSNRNENKILCYGFLHRCNGVIMLDKSL
jgi:hypothetical protein